MIRARLTAADYLDRRAGTQSFIRGPIMVPARMASRTARVPMPRPPQSRMEVISRSGPSYSAFTTELMVRRAVAGRKEIRHMPGAAHHGAVGVAIDHAPGKKVYFPAPVDHGVKHGVSPGACPTDRIILSSITALVYSKNPSHSFGDVLPIESVFSIPYPRFLNAYLFSSSIFHSPSPWYWRIRYSSSDWRLIHLFPPVLPSQCSMPTSAS